MLMIAPPQLLSSPASEHNWVVPPLDGSLSLPQILHFNYMNNGNKPLFVYADANNSLQYISWSFAVSAAYKAAAILLELQLPKNSVIAIFAKIDFATYWAYVHGALMAGYQPFPISPRNSSPIVAHLLKSTSTSAIITDADGSLHKIAVAAVDNLKETLYDNTILLTAQSFHEIFKNNQDIESITRALHGSMSSTVIDLDSKALILHTSGSSSAFPKPISLTHRILVQQAQAPWYGNISTSGQIIGAASLVLFHVIGFLCTGMAASMGSVLAIFSPDAPSSFPTPDSVIECYIKTSARYAACVPSFLEKWAEEPAYVEVLKKMGGVIYGGGMLNRGVGDMLSQQGVLLITTYGLTEIGTISEIICYPHSRESWEYFRISKMVKPVYQAQDDGTMTVEVYVLPNALHTPAVLSSKLDGCDCYKTNDLLEPHPEIEGLWRVYGRVDSQIILSTGEKTNPTPIEAIICESPLIRSAVMFGRGRSQNGIILDLYPEHMFDPTDDLKLAEFRSAIRPFIDKANAHAPSHSRLIDDLIIIASPAKPFSFSSKGAPRRAAIIDEYSREIDAIYNTLGEVSSLKICTPDPWNETAISQFVDKLLYTTLEGAVGREDDIFHAGCSSLQATQILNVIRLALKKHEFSSRSIPDNFVYEHPTSGALIDALIQVGSCGLQEEKGMENTSATILESLLHKYTNELPPKLSQIELPSAARGALATNEDVVLLTGSTGALGCAILSVLAQDPTVRKVYAINRPHKGIDDLKERQTKALNEREMDSSILQNPKIVLIEADILSDNLGLSQNIYSEVKSAVTRIIHVAWSVRWDIQVSSFEPQIASVRKLVDFALECSTLPLLIFTSSISVLSKWAKDYPAPELPINAQDVAGSGGYAESKWVGEQIILHASKTTNLHSTVVRVGQLTGLPSGAWNASEWVPSIIRSASSLGCLPDAPGEVSWLPIMSAAHSLASLKHPTQSILHLVHPNPVQWHTIFSAAASTLNIPLVPYAAWLAKLDLSDPDEKIPATRLLFTFRNGSTSVLDGGHEALGAAKLAFINTEECLPGFREENPLGQKDVEEWIGYWQRHRLL